MSLVILGLIFQLAGIPIPSGLRADPWYGHGMEKAMEVPALN